ncbi:hypothetical protein AVEN_150208-1 [Araneus ventricosus]|uniref:Uncharacterized protein n=1 Tax=Araneus ventricosus TaxID=182803 RepID=A0A4Y2TI08_ARAVE|nr:hypothetical protein AVEN_150208-1 [Araneus ventricosus]
MRALAKSAKKLSFHFGAPSPVFRTGARLKPLDPGRVSKFQEHQTIKFGRSFTGQTEQTAAAGNPILGDRMTIGAVRSTVPPPHPAFKTSPP